MWDCLAIGLNGVIGSGIYLQLAPLAQRAGPASVLGVLGSGLMCSLVALCFAELSGMFDRSGGSYVYARAAFGTYVGFGVGWMSTVANVLGYAAVALGFAEQLLPPALTPYRVLGLSVSPQALVAVAGISFLGVLNYLGVKLGARTLDVLSVAKVLPLVALAAVGLFFVRGEVLAQVVSPSAVPAEGGGYGASVLGTAFLAVFMLSGFEYTTVPAGEVKHARLAIPLATVGALLGATVLYCALMLVAHSVLPDLAAHAQPLPEVATRLVGPWGGQLLRTAALVSMAGFCAGSALVGPRYFTALAEDGFLPARLTALTRHGTPGPAVVLNSAVTSLLVLFLGFGALVDISLVALFVQYIATALAVIALRRTLPDAPRAWRLPWGPVIPALATGTMLGLLGVARPAAREWLLSLEVLVLGVGVWGATAWFRRQQRARAGAKPAPPPQAG